jgi:hypothetical protein
MQNVVTYVVTFCNVRPLERTENLSRYDINNERRYITSQLSLRFLKAFINSNTLSNHAFIAL